MTLEAVLDGATRKRAMAYAITALALVLSFTLVARSSWHSSDQVHTLFDMLATIEAPA